MTSNDTQATGPSTIGRHEAAIYPAMAMLAGMQLEVFTTLKDGPLTAEEVAAAIDVKSTKLRPLLDALVAADLLNLQNDRFSNTMEADTYLVEGRPSYVAGSRRQYYADIWAGLLKTAASIRTGAPQHKHDFYAMSEEEMAAFFRGQHFNAVAAGEQLARIYDFSRFHRVLDIGTGSGGVAIGILQGCPGLSVTVADLARVIPVTRQFLEGAALQDSVAMSTVDILAGAPDGNYDVAIMRNLIQILSLEDALTAVRHVAQSLISGGTLLVVGSMLEDSRQSPVDLVGLNLVFLNIYDDGLIYTEGEYRALLTEAGFADIAVRRGEMPVGNVLISARKPD
jgi:2-hydroxy-4-(methylsulfanyl)butanoate S-methyltransferase